MSKASDKQRMSVYLAESDKEKIQAMRYKLTAEGLEPPNASQVVRAAIKWYHAKLVNQ